MIDIALLIVFPALMAYAAASDLFTMTIPNALSLALIGAFGVFALLAGLPPAVVLLHVAACALVLAVCFGLFAFGWIGGGDAKLASATALWFGFGALLDYLFLATIAGGALTLLILAARAALAGVRAGLRLGRAPAQAGRRRPLRHRPRRRGARGLSPGPDLVGAPGALTWRADLARSPGASKSASRAGPSTVH